AAAELSQRYINERFLPDKAIDLLDEAGSEQMLRPPSRRNKTLRRADIERVVARIAKIPPETATQDDREQLRDLEGRLKERVFGQDEAVKVVSDAVKVARAGLSPPQRPMGCFLFAGPTGVGKTELARQLAEIMGVQLLRFDMSEYMERHTASRLVGAPPGYVGFDQGGLLTEAVTKNPYGVLLLDEIEKAHPDVFNLLLQVMDSATLTDNNGRKADFRKCVLIMTSNAGAQNVDRPNVGFTPQERAPDIIQAIERKFTPEFRNRLDAIVQFDHLGLETVMIVVDKFIGQLQDSLKEKGVKIKVSSRLRRALAEQGYDRRMGARPMEAIISEKLRKPLADMLLFGDLENAPDNLVQVDLNAKGEVVWKTASKSKPAKKRR
ncbi:MAG: AAA family ATPase, partial [Gammaproteobacteria bacterium AqS3]|nr:AAA family ATPase [Gammaproteobacteria bacterium AqS3]